MDLPTFIGSIIGAGGLGSVVTRLYDRKRRSGERYDNVLVKLIADCEKRHDERDGKLETLEAEVRTLLTEHAELKAEHGQCPKRHAELVRRVYRLENRLTPTNGTPVVRGESTDRMILPPPIMHESVGGHERDPRRR